MITCTGNSGSKNAIINQFMSSLHLTTATWIRVPLIHSRICAHTYVHAVTFNYVEKSTSSRATL